MKKIIKSFYEIMIGISTIAGCVAAFSVVPEVRQLMGLDSERGLGVSPEKNAPVVLSTPVLTISTSESPLQPRPAEITDSRGAPMRLVPAGTFTMGGSADNVLAECEKFRNDCKRDWFTNEEPIHVVETSEYYIDKYEVTNALYKVCAEAGVCQPPSITRSSTRPDYYDNSQYVDYPVIYVNWYQAQVYCKWRGARLPTEAEWEKAARGQSGYMYPWGNEFNAEGVNFCDKNCPFSWKDKNYNDNSADTASVFAYPNGTSEYGVYNMAGNVWEWTSSIMKPYPYALDDGRENQQIESERVARGGAWDSSGDGSLLTVRRIQFKPYDFRDILGFRCVRTVNP